MWLCERGSRRARGGRRGVGGGGFSLSLAMQVGVLTGERVVEMLWMGMFLAAAVVLALYARMRNNCDACCSTGALAGPPGAGCEAAACSEADVLDADACTGYAAKLLTGALGLLVCGFTLRGIVRYVRKRARAAEREKAQ